jgi:hypothetical protein
VNSVDTDNSAGIAPLGAGDLIDRAVRFYRRYFWTLVLIAAPPVIAGTLISVAWTLLSRSLFNTGLDVNSGTYFLYLAFTWVGGIVIWLTESIATLAVMGGASRNFVRHLLFNEPITFRETYRNVGSRFAGLIVASTIMMLLLGFLGLVLFYIGFIVAFLLVALAIGIFAFFLPLGYIVAVALGTAAIAATIWLFFMIASRFAYIPQVMLVEGQGVLSALSRSAGLASGNVKRLIALFLFSIAATYSALALFYVPLGWYAWVEGVELFAFGSSDLVPAWYEIASQLVWQASLILLSPVWMIGLCLLYVDERVRHEGYDIELMAARRLGDIPAVPTSYVNPLQPALAGSGSAETVRPSGTSILGLDQ